MSRFARTLIIAALLVGVWAVAAQDVPPAVTPEPGFPTLPLAEASTPDPALLAATLPPSPEEVTPVPEGEVVAPPESGLGLEQSEAIPILINARADLELLASAAIGSEQRPLGWSGSIDVTDSQLMLWIRLDLETLVGAVMGTENRPVGWFGVVPSVPLAVARDIRHDLELLADIVIGAEGIRPAGWRGDDPLMRCSRSIQALFTALEDRGITFQIDFAQPDYCVAAENATTRYVEREILQPPPAIAIAGDPSNQARYPFLVESPFVAAFLDRNARRKIGVVPEGTGFEPISRSTFGFSNMMIVQGDNFQVFVDYTTTQVTNDQFLALPDMGEAPATSCLAEWCGQNID